MNISQTKDMLIYVAERIMENRDELCRIDAQIGDGDHGIGMYNGMKKAKEALESREFGSVSDIFTTMGTAMLMTMGGASGVIFGTVFMGAFKEEPDLQKLDAGALARGMCRSQAALGHRVKSQLGDKTMLDAFIPAVEALEACQEESLIQALGEAEKAAKAGVEATKGYVAKYGRAKTLGERAVGFQDAGATSVYLIFHFMREWVEANG